MREITGKVKAIRKDKKGIMLESEEGDIWFGNNYLKPELTCKRGDEVTITINDKGFLEKVVVKGEGKEQENFVQTKKNPKEDYASYCLSYAKDLVVAGKVEYSKIKECALNLLSIYEEMIKVKPEEKPVNPRLSIINLLKKGDDVEIEKVPEMLNLPVQDVEREVKHLLEAGIIYEPRPGVLKYLG